MGTIRGKSLRDQFLHVLSDDHGTRFLSAIIILLKYNTFRAIEDTWGADVIVARLTHQFAHFWQPAQDCAGPPLGPLFEYKNKFIVAMATLWASVLEPIHSSRARGDANFINLFGPHFLERR